MTRAINEAEITNEILSLLLKKKNRVEKMLDITLEQQALLNQGYIDEFLTLMKLRQDIIDEIENINDILDSYPGINNLTSDYLEMPSPCINNNGKIAYYNQKDKRTTCVIAGVLNQIEEIHKEISKTYLQVQDLVEINKQTLHHQLETTRKELTLLQNTKARQMLYDQLPAQYSGAFLDRKK